MMSATMKRAAAGVVLVCVGALACGGEQEEAAETAPEAQEPTLEDKGGQAQGPPSAGGGKADEGGEGGVVERGALALGASAEQRGAFDGSEAYHAYTLEVPAGVKIDLEVTQRGSSRGLDTTLFVLGPRQTGGAFPREVFAFDDDSGWGLLSRLRGLSVVEGGTYWVVVGTYSGAQSGAYRLTSACADAACEAKVRASVDPLAEACVFGTQYQDLSAAQALSVTARRAIRADSAVTALEQAQVVAAVASAYAEAATFEQAMGLVDEGRVDQTRLWDASARRAFVAYAFGAGENTYGAIVEAGSTEAAALIADGDFYGCDASWGPERRACADSAECAAGLVCEGVYGGRGVCLDPRQPPHPNEGLGCMATSDCGPNTGLLCAGAWGGFEGLCQEARLQRAFAAAPDALIPDGDPRGVSIDLDVWGLATVATDVSIELRITHDAPEQLRVTLTNPDGTEAVVIDGATGPGGISLDGATVRGFPGDERANGTWTLTAVDRHRGGRAGVVRAFAVTVASRYD